MFFLSLPKLQRVITILGFLGVALTPVTAQEKAISSAKPKILPFPPESDERWALIESFKNRAPDLIQHFESFIYTNLQGESMPYRLYIPRWDSNSGGGTMIGGRSPASERNLTIL